MENRINQLKADADKLMEKAGTMCPVSLVNDLGIGVNADAVVQKAGASPL